MLRAKLVLFNKLISYILFDFHQPSLGSDMILLHQNLKNLFLKVLQG